MTLVDGTLAAHAFCTVAMTGLIWFVQIVHYPLFARVGADAFREYATQHNRRVTWVVAPLMLLEVATAGFLCIVEVPGAPAGLGLIGLGLVFVIWVSTAVLQVPCHARLQGGPDGRVIRRLVATNWVRTVAWTLRCGVVWAYSASTRAL